MAVAPQRIRVTEIGEFIRHASCERRFKLDINNRSLARQLPFYERLFNPLDPVLQESGRKRENEWEQYLKKSGLRDLTNYLGQQGRPEPTPWSTFANRIAELEQDQEAYGREVSVEAPYGAFLVDGRIDFVLLLWRDGRPVLRLVECKASRRDRTYQHIQVAMYQVIVSSLLESQPLSVADNPIVADNLECVVARIDETTGQSNAILDLERLDLEQETADLDRLLASDGMLGRIAASDLSDLEYCLDSKCDGCVFNVNCLPEAARLRGIQLLGVEPATIRMLRDAGVTTIDELAELDLQGVTARSIRSAPSLTESLEVLHTKAKTRRRTLPGGDANPDQFEVTALPNAGQGELPEHTVRDHRLVRVYLSVAYDYVENRVGALSAHVTASEWGLHTDFVQSDGKWKPDPAVKERIETGRDENGRPVYSFRALVGRNVIRCKATEWTGDYTRDNGAEAELIQSFLQELVGAIADVASTEVAPIHFYVWSRTEITRLVEACSRVGSRLLGSLRELLGCRDSLEQLIYSCLQNEVESRYALGWTGRGLSVVTSLQWFGRRYHWKRTINGAEVDLSSIFTQDIFDFKTDLELADDGGWADRNDEIKSKHKFEIRSRFHDSLTAPYWRAVWRTLPGPTDKSIPAQVRGAIARYNMAAKPNYLDTYLRARVHALRWVEEGVSFKNPDIDKPLMTIASLPDFRLGVDTTAQAAIDFLRLDQHVKVTNWITFHLSPPSHRVFLGRTIPVRNVVSHGNNRLTASIDLDSYHVDAAAVATKCTIGEGAFVRLSPYSGDPLRGQTLGQLMRGGKTCRISSIDWATGQVELEVLWLRANRYLLDSVGENFPRDVYDYATIDESPSDLVAGDVDNRLQNGRGSHACRWFDPARPDIPSNSVLPGVEAQRFERILERLVVSGGNKLRPDQAEACLQGLGATVQLLLGPPGTGKTLTTSVATLLRVLAKRQVGDIVLVAAHTHTAVDNLLQRIDSMLDNFGSACQGEGISMPNVRLLKVHSSEIGPGPGGRVQNFVSRPCVRLLNSERADSVLIIGGTTKAILKMSQELSQRRPFSLHPSGFQVPLLVVDEASMMVFPHFLALATLVSEDGEIMLAGDHRQLSPIVAHDWEREDRPPMILYQPFSSAYAAVDNIKQNLGVNDNQIVRSALRFTFRLPPAIRELIARLYRKLDSVELEGHSRSCQCKTNPDNMTIWERLWYDPSGLFLVLHSERQSKQCNEFEVELVKRILASSDKQSDCSVAIVTPHRAQRSLLKSNLEKYRVTADIIDTVERLQGGERPTIIVSATASDPAAIAANAEFIMDLNRSNVAFSRAKERLIVVCSEALLDHIASEIDDYESAMLWKALRSCCSSLVGEETIDGHSVRVFTPPEEIAKQVESGLALEADTCDRACEGQSNTCGANCSSP